VGSEHVMKIVIIGDAAVGKTSFVHRYVNGQFSQTYLPTMGGQERFVSMTRVYYKGALGCVVMFDVTKLSSFLKCHHWKQDLDNKVMLPSGAPIPCILLANKCDLPERVVTADSIAEFSKNNGFFTWMETSVRDNRNVDEAMRFSPWSIFYRPSCEDQTLSSLEDSVDLQSRKATKRKNCC
uniref:RAB29, member RAS oncogene family n=1 Tax=Salarias fasciatus TaxID=181472 RepID=A0A672HWI3_SALFA